MTPHGTRWWCIRQDTKTFIPCILKIIDAKYKASRVEDSYDTVTAIPSTTLNNLKVNGSNSAVVFDADSHLYVCFPGDLDG